MKNLIVSENLVTLREFTTCNKRSSRGSALKSERDRPQSKISRWPGNAEDFAIYKRSSRDRLCHAKGATRRSHLSKGSGNIQSLTTCNQTSSVRAISSSAMRYSTISLFQAFWQHLRSNDMQRIGKVADLDAKLNDWEDKDF